MVLHRNTIRLPHQNYAGKRLYFVTACTEGRRPVFSNLQLGEWLVKRLRTISARQNFSVHAYCVMPDHAHLLVEGTHENCDVIAFISLFKQVTGFAFEKRFGHTLWQFKFYDHILRSAERVDAVAWYIWLNPVRKGLCAAPQQYPLSGSLTFNWLERCAPVYAWNPRWKRPKATEKMPP